MAMQPHEFKALREIAGLTQGQFAEALGMNRVTISRMESGEAPIERRTEVAASAVAYYFDCLKRLKTIDESLSNPEPSAEHPLHDVFAHLRREREFLISETKWISRLFKSEPSPCEEAPPVGHP